MQIVIRTASETVGTAISTAWLLELTAPKNIKRQWWEKKLEDLLG